MSDEIAEEIEVDEEQPPVQQEYTPKQESVK